MFSLCIPTMNRYDTYLHKFISQYLQMDLFRLLFAMKMEKMLKKYNEIFQTTIS